MDETLDTQSRLRRNGKQQSCEPCRLRKQSCSHQTPCARCIRHKRNCIYVDAPMSRERKAEATPLPTPARTASVASSPRRPPRPVSASIRNTPTQDNPLTLQSGGSFGYRRTHVGLSLGYVGSTGYSAILDEAKSHIGMNIWDIQDAPSDTLPWGTRPDGTNPGRALCRSILAWLPSRGLMDRAREWMTQELSFSTYPGPSIDAWHTAFWEVYADTLEEPREEATLVAMIDELIANTRRPLPTNPATNAEWMAAYSGRKSRWELVGDMFIMLGCLAAFAPDSDPLLVDLLPPEFKNKKKNYACSMLECADACLMLCDSLDYSSNIHIAGLLNRCCILQSIIMGDSSYELWKRVGQVANAVTGLGLHRKVENPEQIAPMYIQQRTKTFVAAYGSCIGIAVFLGRPPALSRRYVNVPLPADVPEPLILEAKKMSDLLPLVRSDGWNAAGNVTAVTMLRIYMITSLLRDEILEISLGQPEYHDVRERVKDLRYRAAASRTELPPIFSSPLDKRAFAERSVRELSCIAQTRLNYLHSEFLIERIEYDGRDEQRCLGVAQEMLNVVVVYWTERDRFPTHRDEVHWFISFAGIPAASALAIDLFKQATTPYAKPFNSQRPDIIQDLSLFVACLDWVRPEDGNYVLCRRVRKMIRHILDRVLSPSVPQVAGGDYSSGYNLNDISINSLPQYGIEFSGWLDGIDAAGIDSDWTNSLLQFPGRFA